MARYDRQLPPLATLVAFETAYRFGSFTRAADELSISQTSISRRVRELEQDLGVKLFERRRYDVVPTQDAVELVAAVRLGLSEIAATSERLRVRAAGGKALTVFSDLSLASSIVTPLIGEFQRRHPEIELRVLSSYEPIETLREDIDIGLQYGCWALDRFVVEPIADDAIFPVCAPALAETLPCPATPVDIAKMPLLHLADLGRFWPDWRSFLAFFRLKEPKPLEGMVFDSYQVCLDVAEKGEGVALGWARSVEPRIASGHLVRIPNMTMPLVDCICVHLAKRARPNPAAKQFHDLLRRSIKPVP